MIIFSCFFFNDIFYKEDTCIYLSLSELLHFEKPSIKSLILLAHYCVTSGYHGKVPVIFTSALTYTEYLTLESAIYILIKEVIWGI